MLDLFLALSFMTRFTCPFMYASVTNVRSTRSAGLESIKPTEMLGFLAERAKKSKWIRKPTRMLKLVPLEKEAETIEEACEKELEGIVEDTEKNTQLVLKVNKDSAFR